MNIRLGKQFSLLISFDNFYFSNLHSLKSDSNTIQCIVQPKNIWLYQIFNKKNLYFDCCFLQVWSCYPSITSILYDGSQDHLKSFFEKRKTDPNLIPMVYEIMTIQNIKARNLFSISQSGQKYLDLDSYTKGVLIKAFKIKKLYFASKNFLTFCEKKLFLGLRKNFWNSMLTVEN